MLCQRPPTCISRPNNGPDVPLALHTQTHIHTYTDTHTCTYTNTNTRSYVYSGQLVDQMFFLHM